MKNMSTKIATVLLTVIILLSGYGHCRAVPAKKGEFYLSQPDGTTVLAKLRGDEFMKILTTADGCTIKMGEDGWYYYAYYGEDGGLVLTGYRAGQKAPADVLAKSRLIPYGQLAAAAAIKRAGVSDAEKGDNALLRIRKAKGLSTKSGENVEERHGLVILAQFKDLKFQEGHTKETFTRMLMESGYDRNGATGSAKDYFDDQYEGYFTFSFDVSDIVTLSKNYAYYGSNDKNTEDDVNAAEMILEACRLADGSVDFSSYDDDGDGYVDNVFVFFAGGDEAEGAGDDHIWSHAWKLSVEYNKEKERTFDGVIVNRYACTSELTRSTFGVYSLAGIGTFCHEFSHTLGLSDYYDTDYEESGGMSEALWGSISLMDSGNSNNDGHTPPNLSAVEKDELGFFEAETLTAGTFTLTPAGKGGKYYRMETDTPGEYFLFECRAEEGWDEYIGGSGLLIYHIDKSARRAGFSSYYGNLTAAKRWNKNEINCNPQYQCADLIEASSRAMDVSEVFFPYRTGSMGNSAFTPATDPAFVFRSGTKSSLSITDIRKSGDNIILTVNDSNGIIALAKETFQDAAILTWRLSAVSEETTCSVTLYGLNGQEMETKEAIEYEPGKFSCTFENLTPAMLYKVKICSYVGDSKEDETETDIKTSSKRTTVYPFIYLYNVTRNDDGTFPRGSKFPLRLFNAYDAEEIVWTMDGKEIATDGSGYYTPESSGTMQAEIYYEDGSTSIVRKVITLK